MKKLFIFALALLLVTACQKADNVLGVDPDMPQGTGAANLPTVTDITPAPGAEIVDQNSGQAGIQGRIEVTFSDYMDRTTVTSLANISLLNTTTGTAISNASITTEYFPEIYKLYIYISDVPTASPYLLRLKSGGMTNTYGSPLDFDGDNNAEGVYDDVLVPYYTTGNTDTLVVPLQPTVASFTPDTSATNNTQPLIALTFAGGSMDTLTLSTANIILTNASGGQQTLNLISRNATSVVVQPASALPTAANYTITVKCANIKRLGDHATPPEYLVLDGDDDGPEATEPDLVSIFRVDDPAAPPRLNSVAVIGTDGVTFNFSRLLDVTTISKTTIAVYDQHGYVPGDLRIYTDGANTYTIVDYFFLRPITTGGRHAWASKTLKATNGYLFDGNNNGIGGEPWDNRDVTF